MGGIHRRVQHVVVPLIVRAIGRSVTELVTEDRVSGIIVNWGNGLCVGLCIAPGLIRLFFPGPKVCRNSIYSTFFVFVHVQWHDSRPV